MQLWAGSLQLVQLKQVIQLVKLYLFTDTYNCAVMQLWVGDVTGEIASRYIHLQLCFVQLGGGVFFNSWIGVMQLVKLSLNTDTYSCFVVQLCGGSLFNWYEL